MPNTECSVMAKTAAYNFRLLKFSLALSVAQLASLQAIKLPKKQRGIEAMNSLSVYSHVPRLAHWHRVLITISQYGYVVSVITYY